MQRSTIPFSMFAERPYILALRRWLLSRSSEPRLPAPYQLFTTKLLYDLVHIKPQTECLLTQSGGFVADHLVRYGQRLETDLVRNALLCFSMAAAWLL